VVKNPGTGTGSASRMSPLVALTPAPARRRRSISYCPYTWERWATAFWDSVWPASA